LIDGTGNTCISTIGLRTVTALKGKAYRTFFLNGDPGGRRNLLLECLDDVPGSRMFHLAMHLTQAAPYTNVFNGINPLHIALRKVYSVLEPGSPAL
jgi:hypothetical protein